MLDHGTNNLTLLSHYLLCLFFVGLLSLGLSQVLNSRRKTEPQIYLEKTGSLILKDAENSP